MRHLLLDQVIPVCLGHQGRLVLHAGAVATPHGVAGFLGPSGRGKSTLTASFVDAGSRFIADDMLLLEARAGGYSAVPSYPSLRLWPDSAAALYGDREDLPLVAQYSTKKRIEATGVPLDDRDHPGSVSNLDPAAESSGSFPVRKLYVLTPARKRSARQVTIAPLSGPQAMVEVIKQTYRLDISDKVRLRQEFLRLSELVSRVPVAALSFPRDYTFLPQVRKAILSDLEELEDREEETCRAQVGSGGSVEQLARLWERW